MADADDVAVADEYRGLAIVDMLAFKVGGAGDDEQLIVIDVDLGQLVGLDRILDRQRVEAVAGLQRMHFLFGWVGDANPYEFALVVGAVDLLVDRDRPDPMSVTIKVGGNDRHGRLLEGPSPR